VTWRLLRALVWLRWRLLVNGLTSAKRRGALERASRWLEVVLPIALFLLLLPVSLGLTGAAVGAGWLLATHAYDYASIADSATLILMLPLAWIVMRPLIAAFSGRSEAEAPLRLLPIPSALLAHLALLQETADPAFLLFAPALVALPLGAVVGGKLLLAAGAAVAGIALLGVLAALGALVSLGVRLLLRDRRRGEVVAIVFFLLLGTAGVLPQFLVVRHRPGGSASSSAPPAEERSGQTKHHWQGLSSALRVSPPGLYGGALAAAAAANWSGAAARAVALALFAAAGLAAVAPLSRYLNETPEHTSRATPARATRPRALRLPFVAPATAAVAGVTFRSAIRTVRGRMVLLMPPVLVAMLAAVSNRGDSSPLPFGGTPLALGAFAVLMTIGNVGVFSCNQFATAGSGFVLELLQPLREVTLVRGRALALAGFSVLALALGLAPLLVLGSHVAPLILLAILLGGVAVEVVVSPLAAALSAVMPKTVDLTRFARGGQPNAGASIAHMLVSGLACLPPAGCLALALAVWRKPWLAPLLTGGWLVCATAAATLLLPVAARVVAARRENLALLAMGN
jgi:hypothetical protein